MTQNKNFLSLLENDVGTKLKKERLSWGMTIQKLSLLSHIDSEEINHIENENLSYLSFEKLVDICKALDISAVTIQELLKNI